MTRYFSTHGRQSDKLTNIIDEDLTDLRNEECQCSAMIITEIC